MPSAICISFATVFQFHKGTIRTRSYYSLFFPQFVFQFHKGTIRTAVIQSRKADTNISIP